MLIAEYSYEEDIQAKQQEARQQGILEGILEGRQEGRREGIFLTGRVFQIIKKNPGLTNGQIAKEVGCSVEDVESTRKMFAI